MPRNLSILSVLPESPKTECHAEMLHLRAALEGDRHRGRAINWVSELQLLDGSRRERMAKADHTRFRFASPSTNWTSFPEEKDLGLSWNDGPPSEPVVNPAASDQPIHLLIGE